MENASKALIMAGGILISIMVISLGIYVFNNAAQLSISYSETLSENEINIFNNKFLVYARDLTPQEMVTVINLIKENNIKYIDDELNQIKLIIDNVAINTNRVSEDWKKYIMEQSETSNEPQYKFISILYNDTNGKIQQVSWRSINSSISSKNMYE